MTITAPGFHPTITAREYFAEPCPAPALTASGIKTLLGKTAAEFAYQHPLLNPDGDFDVSTAAKRFGDVAHQLALGKGRGYAVGDYPTWGSKDAKTFKEDAEDRGLTPVKRAEFETAVAAAKVMKAKIVEMLASLASTTTTPPYTTETVIIWQEQTRHGMIWCRAMLDCWCEPLGVILDPKFSKQLRDGVFENHATNMGWDFQTSWYLRGASALLPERAGRLRFLNLLVHPDAPHVSRAREADEATRYSAQVEIERAIDMFAGHLKAGAWPGYTREIEPWSAKPGTLAQRAANLEMENADG